MAIILPCSVKSFTIGPIRKESRTPIAKLNAGLLPDVNISLNFGDQSTQKLTRKNNLYTVSQ